MEFVAVQYGELQGRAEACLGGAMRHDEIQSCANATLSVCGIFPGSGTEVDKNIEDFFIDKIILEIEATLDSLKLVSLKNSTS